MDINHSKYIVVNFTMNIYLCLGVFQTTIALIQVLRKNVQAVLLYNFEVNPTGNKFAYLKFPELLQRLESSDPADHSYAISELLNVI